MDLRYPIGEFKLEGQPTAEQLQQFIADIEQTPSRLRAAVDGLFEQQLETPYRPGGWTVRQVAHHVPESHMNAYVRMKLALTEDNPTIKPYDEARWAETPDVRGTPIATSLVLLEALHHRWITLLRRLGPADFASHVRPSRQRSVDARWICRALFLARKAPRGAHHQPARAHGMVAPASRRHVTPHAGPLAARA